MAFHGKIGDRVKLVYMPNDLDPIKPGDTGTVTDITALDWGAYKQTQVLINWDNGRRLSCVCPPDHLEIITVKNL